jgi:hypothetical protein
MILVDDVDEIDDDKEKENVHFSITLTINNSVFYYMTPHSLSQIYQVFGGIHCLHLQG